MFDHVTLSVRRLAHSVAFYTAVLKPLGVTNRVSYPGHKGHAPLEGFGAAGERYLLLKKGKPDARAVHLAFRAKSRKAVDAFYAAAIGAGARDNGPPGARVHYFPSYYAAYVLDLDGYNVEAVYQGWSSRPKQQHRGRADGVVRIGKVPLRRAVRGGMNNRVLVGASGAALVTGFFLPWISLGGMFKASAFDLMRAQQAMGGVPSFALALVPLAGLLLVFLAVTDSSRARLASVLTGVGILGYGLYRILDTFLTVTGSGMWVVVAAAVVAVIAPLASKK